MKAIINFTGDIMCNRHTLRHRKTENGYDFSDLFERTYPALHDCNFLVGNFETPVAPKFEQTKMRWSFNAPVSFLEKIKEGGFDLLCLANNHCTDRGFGGLMNTLEEMKAKNMQYIGCAATPKERETVFVKTINGIKVAFLNYTYGTNAFANREFLTENEAYSVCLTQPQETLKGSIHLLLEQDEIARETKAIYEEKDERFAFAKPYLDQIEKDIKKAKELADAVIFVLHSGGQYNTYPDAYTKMLVDFITKRGVTAVIGHHPHIIQKSENVNGVPVFYSAGNFSWNCTDKIPPREICPRYAYILKLILELQDGKVTVKPSFSLVKTVNENGRSVTYLMSDLIKSAKGSKKAWLIAENRRYVNIVRNLPQNTPVVLSEFYDINI